MMVDDTGGGDEPSMSPRTLADDETGYQSGPTDVVQSRSKVRIRWIVSELVQVEDNRSIRLTPGMMVIVREWHIEQDDGQRAEEQIMRDGVDPSSFRRRVRRCTERYSLCACVRAS